MLRNCGSIRKLSSSCRGRLFTLLKGKLGHSINFRIENWESIEKTAVQLLIFSILLEFYWLWSLSQNLNFRLEMNKIDLTKELTPSIGLEMSKIDSTEELESSIKVEVLRSLISSTSLDSWSDPDSSLRLKFMDFGGPKVCWNLWH